MSLGFFGKMRFEEVKDFFVGFKEVNYYEFYSREEVNFDNNYMSLDENFIF